MSRPSELYGRPWSEREYIIVLHYYFKHHGKSHDSGCDYVKELARLLGRTPASVVMRLQNYASLDGYRGARGRGLRHIGPQGQKVFEDWVHKVDALRSCGEVFVREAERASVPTLFDPEPIRVAKAFGNYELGDFLGEGSFGSVFSCVNIDDGREYAIKIIKTGTIDEGEVLGRFRREMKALRAVTHENVVRIYADNLDDTEGFPAFVMDLAEGDLFDYIQMEAPKRRGSQKKSLLPFPVAVGIMRAVIAGVQTLHNSKPQILHRDINPKNILRLVNGNWVLADFSLAKFLPDIRAGSTFRTHTGQARGTEPFTAPEQWGDFAEVDVKADVFSLGVLLWELFSPEWPPFASASRSLPGGLGALLLKAAERDPLKRCVSVERFAESFERAVKHAP